MKLLWMSSLNIQYRQVIEKYGAIGTNLHELLSYELANHVIVYAIHTLSEL